MKLNKNKYESFMKGLEKILFFIVMVMVECLIIYNVFISDLSATASLFISIIVNFVVMLSMYYAITYGEE